MYYSINSNISEFGSKNFCDPDAVEFLHYFRKWLNWLKWLHFTIILKLQNQVDGVENIPTPKSRYFLTFGLNTVRFQKGIKIAKD